MTDAEHDREPERYSDLAVMDEREFKQKQRLKCLLEAREKVKEKTNEAWELFVAGEINVEAKNILIQRAVKEAIWETFNHLVDHEEESIAEEKHSPYWVGYERLEKTEDGVRAVAGDGGAEPLGVIPQDSQPDIPIWGLADFMETETFYEETIERTVKPRNQPARTEEETIKRTVPEDVSIRAFLRLTRFLGKELNLDIEFEEDDGLQAWGFYEISEEDLPEGEYHDE